MEEGAPRLTEEALPWADLEQLSVVDLLTAIHQQDSTVPAAVEKAIPQLVKLTEAVIDKLEAGGRLFYIGSGTSGRLGVMDAAEWPPTFGTDPNRAIALIAGGDGAIRKAREFAEDDEGQGWKDLLQHQVNQSDIVIGLSASGCTPYVLGAVRQCRQNEIVTGCITCNPHTPLAAASHFPVEVITGPEFIAGSTRMKAATAQKMILHMLSTTVLVRLGHVLGNQMVDMQLTNQKLIDRGTRILMRIMAWDYDRARHILLKYGSVRQVLLAHRKIVPKNR